MELHRLTRRAPDLPPRPHLFLRIMALAWQSASHSRQRDWEVQPVPTRSDTFTEAYRAPCLLGYSILSDPRTQAVPVLHPLVHRTSKDIPPSLPATAFVSLSAYGE